MGCDIHLRVERKIDGVWRKINPPEEAQDPWLKEQASKATESDNYYAQAAEETWYDDRSYKCFSILANVRNGYGAAGVDTGDTFIPISEPRGFPEDLGPDLIKDIEQYEDGEKGWWPGDHSFSWLLVSELLAYDWQRKIKNRGVMKFEQFLERVKNNDTSWPEAYSGGIFGHNIVTITRAEALKRLQGSGLAVEVGVELYVQEEWESTYAEAAGRFYSEVLPALAKIDPDPSNVRIVFGFDS